MWQKKTGVLTLCCLLSVIESLAAPPSPEHQAQVKQAEAALTRAGNFFRAKKYSESGEASREAHRLIVGLPADDSKAWQNLLAPARRQLSKARELLAAQGISLPALDDADDSSAAISFTKDIAPLLITKCGSCHIQRNEGGLSMRTFADLTKGSATGSVIVAKDPANSQLIKVVESGDMPRDGSGLPRSELTRLKAWVLAGAIFDGDKASTPLTDLAPDTQAMRAPELQTTVADADDEVHFARDLGPVLIQHCLSCHGENNGGNGFSMSTFARFLRGGGNGPPFIAENPAESLLIKKLRGTALGERMPRGRDPLPEATIAKIEKWITLGGKFDGYDAEMPLERLVDQVQAADLSHDDLAKKRSELAQETWRLILPDSTPNQVVGKSVLVLGAVDPETLTTIAQSADAQTEKLQKLFSVPTTTPLIKGRVTLFVFAKRYDYGEIGTMLERREIPPGWRGHWNYNPLDPYACILLSEDGTAPSGLIAQQLAGIYVASLGAVPHWFSEGSARAVASRIDPRDPRIRQWDQHVTDILGRVEKPEGFLAGDLPPEESDVLSYSFVSKLLMSPLKRYVALVTALQAGTNFEQAFTTAYGDLPADVVPNWTTRVTKRRR